MPTFLPDEYPILFQKAWRHYRTRQRHCVNLIGMLFRTNTRNLSKMLPTDRKKARNISSNIAVQDSANDSNRHEEILAKALKKLDRSWAHPGGGRFRLLDYQFPLKAQESDQGIGKVDLLGVTDQGRLMAIELKVKPGDGSRGETPMKALMEGLRYAAIVKANQDAIAQEAKVRFNEEISAEPPLVQILAPKSWWEAWLNLGDSTRTAAGNWEPEFAQTPSGTLRKRSASPLSV